MEMLERTPEKTCFTSEHCDWETTIGKIIIQTIGPHPYINWMQYLSSKVQHAGRKKDPMDNLSKPEVLV